MDMELEAKETVELGDDVGVDMKEFTSPIREVIQGEVYLNGDLWILYR